MSKIKSLAIILGQVFFKRPSFQQYLLSKGAVFIGPSCKSFSSLLSDQNCTEVVDIEGESKCYFFDTISKWNTLEEAENVCRNTFLPTSGSLNQYYGIRFMGQLITKYSKMRSKVFRNHFGSNPGYFYCQQQLYFKAY